MKRIVTGLIGVCLLLSVLCGCGKAKLQDARTLTPDSGRIQSICNLATLECYFHNVAKSQTAGFWNIGATQKTFWIEYTGTVKIGVDVSKVRWTIEDERISVTMPKAQVLDISVDDSSYNDESFYSEKNNFLNGKITADEQTQAIKEAQEQMKASAEANESLLLTAQQRAKEMLSNYFQQLGSLSGKNYQIEWMDIPVEEPEQALSQ